MKNLILLISLFLFCHEYVHGQCNSTTKWPSSDVSLNPTNGSGALQTVNTCLYTGEHSVFINVVSGNTYRFGISLSTAYITIKTGSAGAAGTVVAQGTQPLEYTPSSTANLFVLYHNNSSCATQATCRITTVQCITCTPPPPAPGDNCSNAINLGSLTSPQNGATNVGGVNNDFSFCSMVSSNDLIYYIDLQSGATLNIGNTVTSYDSRHSLRYGGSCPGTIQIVCTDDPNTKLETWTNNTGQTQRVYWIVAGHLSNNGTFTFAWNVEDPPTCFPASNLVVSNIGLNSADFSWTAASPIPQVGYQWAVTTSATPPASGSLVSGTFASANNLNSSTQYWLHVRSDCAVDDYSIWRSASFITIAPGDNCSNAINLGSLSSPQNGATNALGVNNDFSFCAMGSSNDMIYYIDLQSGATLNIGQTVNNYDSRHSLRYGGSCPGSIEIICTDDPDTKLETWTNNTGLTQRVYWIVAGFGANSGTFTFAWDVIAPPSCLPISNLLVSNIGLNSADFSWTAASPIPQVGYQWAVTTSSTPPASGSLVTGTSASSNNLNSDTQYWLHVRSDCGVDDFSTWMSASFRTLITGGICEVAHIVPSLPYTTTDNTSGYGDNYNGSPGSSGCGSTFSYLGGDDVVYAYTANFDGCITITMSPTATYSGIFVYGSCSDIGTACLAGVANSGSTPRVISNFYVTTGQTYYLVISTWPTPQSTGFTLSIAECARDFTMATPYVDNTSLVAGQSTFTSVFHNSVGANTSYSLFVNMGYYLSADDQFDANDILLDTDVSVFNTNSLSNYETSFIQIPENTATGEYYILFVSDHYDEYVEDNEGNNVESIAITINEQVEGDDFFITEAAVSATTVSPGGTLSASCLQNYSGSSEATLNVAMGYYYSTDAIWDASDVLLNTDESTLSASDTSDEEDATITIPISAVAGTAYILFVADHTDAFEETDEDNNVSAIAITIDAPPVGNDFFIANATTNHAQRNPGQSLSMSCHQSYAGSSFSTLIVRMGYYLSTDDQFDAGDVRLGTDNSGLSATKTSEYEDLTRNIPFGTAHGYYYILFVADDNGIYAETNENNNTVAIPITIGNPPANRTFNDNQQIALKETEKSEDFMFSNNRNRNDLFSAEIKISPNPFSHFITIDWQNAEIEAMDCIIRDHTGRLVANFKNVTPGVYLETNNLISGMYVMEMYTINGTLINRFKVIKVE